ncbi:MAG: lipopolysaccharide transport periplasmic protein LptA [Desulfuromonas sp.]|nr:lipopolysaccharide transport periplasmic protein LptA [Desulfuromonas sp.]
MTRCWILCAGLILMAGTALAGPPAFSGANSRGPVEISADRLEADDVAKSLVFIGHAVAKQGDITINGDRLIIYYAAQGGDVDRIIAEGSVRIVQGNRLATGSKAEYFRAEERMVLSGSPRVTDGRNAIQGDQIELFLKENRSVVKSGKDGRVNALFQPSGEATP